MSYMLLPPIGPDLSGEIWKPVPGYETLIEVSSKGRLRSTPRKLGTAVSSALANGESGYTAKRYLCANLPGPVCGFGRPRCKGKSRSGSAAWQVPIHRLVALVFLGPNPPEKTQVNHKDGNKLNNSLENLEYCTPAENAQHAYATGLNDPNKRRKKRLGPAIYDEIRDLYIAGGWTHETLAVKYGVSATNIGYILHRSKATLREKVPVVGKAPGRMR